MSSSSESTGLGELAEGAQANHHLLHVDGLEELHGHKQVRRLDTKGETGVEKPSNVLGG